MADPAAVLRRLDEAAERHWTPCGDGRMVWRCWGEGVPVLLLHGGAGSWRHWARNIPALAATARVLAPDLPGLGDSDPPPEPGSAEAIAGLLRGGLDRLLPATADLHIVGFSFGGIPGGHLAAMLGSRARTLTLTGTGGMGLPRGALPDIRRQQADMAPDQRAAAHRHNLAALMFGDPDRIDDLALHIHQENTRRARFREHRLAGSDTLLAALPRVAARLHGIWGGRDVYAAPHIAERERLFRRIQPDAGFTILDGVGHWVPYEAADQFNALVARILAGR